MKIRVKLMLWYTLFTSILLLIFILVLYNAIATSLLNNEKSQLESAMSQAILGIELENNLVSIQSDIKISYDTPVIIWDKNEQIIFINHTMAWPFNIPFLSGDIREVAIEGKKWLVYDKAIPGEDENIAKIRVCDSLDSMENTLQKTVIIIFIIVPLYFLITIFGGLFIAKKALQPIIKITTTAKNIQYTDLSQRIMGITSADEVGELAETFNKMLQHLEQSFKKEKRFSSDASHELRTPVTVIMAHTEAMLATEQEDEMQKSLTTILTESKHMSAIISQLLVLTRGTEGKYIPKFEQINLHETVNAVLEQMQDAAEAAAITLEHVVEGEIVLAVDQSLITQMLLNMIENCIKYGKRGGHVWVRVKAHDNMAVITLSDDGIGISKDDMPYLFDRFFRADKSRDRSGTGLGLSIVKWIVDEHKGKITVESAVDEGTTFNIWLPNHEALS